ncbi:MAG TPA: ABC transporter ATP-binding protein [Caldithrix abyssi]|uniref:ABC transporter ATP-binding protein n=1 Tax=Caldithrix abyssi TaxID=187145 RepID=A0A7V1PTF6_CALAY|nr:ABC transporter ATP-binding protein [Caldithrix abyssi]
MNEFAVSVKDLTRTFGDFTAVDHISFNVARGEIFGFLGANGAGKTTTIRMLCGLLMPSSGMARVAGLDVYSAYEQIKQRIGYMSQKFSLYEDLTVRENIEFYGGIYGLNRRQIRQKTAELVQYLGLEKQVDQLTRSLPLGWKQRMALSAAILHDPDIIFLDEPTSGVDPVSRRNFWLLIYELADRGKTIFVTTHYMDEAEYCHRLSIMKDGRIVELDEPRRLKERYGRETMQEVFMEIVNRKGEQ